VNYKNESPLLEINNIKRFNNTELGRPAVFLVCARWLCGIGLLLSFSAATFGAEPSDSCSSPDLAQPSLGGKYRDYAGKTITAIRYTSVDVFDTTDPREDNSIYRFLNWLHINTRPGIIAPQLLFGVGDRLRTDRLAESERLLRTRPYLGDATIQVDEVCGENVALLVVTRDIWTLEPQVDLSRQGGETGHGFGVSEENLFGTGTALTLGYDKDEERSRTSLSFYTPHLLNTRIETRLSVAETSDGQQSMVNIQRPFFSLDTTWAAGTENWDITQDETIRYMDEDINGYSLAAEHHEVFAGWAYDRHESFSKRLSIGLTQDREQYKPNEDTQQPVPADENRVYGWLQYQYVESAFAVYRNLNLLHRTEDILMGMDLQLRLGHGGSALGNDQDFTQYELKFSDVLGVGKYHLLQFEALGQGRQYRGGLPDERVLGGDLGYHYLLGDKLRTYVLLHYSQGHELAQHRELTLGGGDDMRGYPVAYQRGDRRYLLRLEQRYISDIHLLNLLRLGGVVYLDAGRAWGAGYDDATHLSNVGLGLRLGSSKAKVGKVLHLDLAFPLADKQYVDQYQLVMTAAAHL
jgi:hypothetical protein